MIKKRKNIIVILIILIFELFILLNPKILVLYSKEALILFINKIFISLFPFFVLNKILIDFNLPYYISKIKKSNPIFSIIILSMLSGMPSNAEYIKDYLENNIISPKEAEKILLITFFPSPVFVITVVGYLGFNSIIVGIVLLIIIYFTNFILFLIIKNKYKTKLINVDVRIKKSNKFMSSLKKAIQSSLESLMIILGNIIMFSILIGLLNKYLNLNIYFESIITSVLELSNGVKKISELITNFDIKFSLCIFALTFSGLSIHFQISSILSKFNIDFFKILVYRLLISIFITFFSYTVLYFVHLLNH